MTAEAVGQDVQQIAGYCDAALRLIEKFDPAVAPEAALADELVKLIGQLVPAALSAYTHAIGVVITADAFKKLMPDETPLLDPTE